ncbi:hypothetical protein [Kribbella sp. NPDC051620]|uniref:hypothetical protein n=1 Tax=Kribbella sp. NPDC051620 TaxID=3364120 RepID=UPI0037B2BAE5
MPGHPPGNDTVEAGLMGQFFQELAKKLAERWISLLTIPGLLFLSTTAIAIAAGRQGFLGHGHALDVSRIASTIGDAADHFGHWSATAQGAALVGVLLTSTGAGLLVQALTGSTRAFWLGQWPRGLKRPAARLILSRQKRYTRLLSQRRELETRFPAGSRSSKNQDRIDQAAGRINRLAMSSPQRPTWMGDRVQAVDQVALNRYGLDLPFSWPRFRLVLPESVSSMLNQSLGQFAVAVLIGAWAAPYLVLGLFWYPALVVGFLIAAVGWARGRAAIADLGDLTEAALDLHGRTLAIALGVGADDAVGPLTPDEGLEITRIVRKGR